MSAFGSSLAALGGCAAIAVLVGCAGTQSATPAANTEMQWGPGYSTPGTRLDLVEIERHAVKPGEDMAGRYPVGSTTVSYTLKATGLTPGKQYELWLGMSFREPVNTHALMDVDARGGVLRRGVAINLAAGNYRRGEPYSVGLISPDSSVKAIAQVYPFPLLSTDGPCRLTLEVLTPDGKTFGAVAEGFPPGSTVETVSRSDGEVQRSQITVPPSGGFSSVIFPATTANRQHASYAVTGKRCKVKVDYEWGAASMAAQ